MPNIYQLNVKWSAPVSGYVNFEAMTVKHKLII